MVLGKHVLIICNVIHPGLLIDLLLSLFLFFQGHMDYYHDIYRILIRLYNWKNIPLEKCLVRLWECRRVSHALCSSPVNDTLVMNLSDHFGELPKSIEFWVDSLKGSRQLVIGFQHNFSFLFANVPGRPCIPKNLFRCEITVDEVKEAALELISSVSSSLVSTRNCYAVMTQNNHCKLATLIGSCFESVVLCNCISLL